MRVEGEVVVPAGGQAVAVVCVGSLSVRSACCVKFAEGAQSECPSIVLAKQKRTGAGGSGLAYILRFSLLQ